MERPSSKCFECGLGPVVFTIGTGRTASYRGKTGFKIPDDLPILTCECCGTVWETEELSRQLDCIFEVQYNS